MTGEEKKIHGIITRGLESAQDHFERKNMPGEKICFQKDLLDDLDNEEIVWDKEEQCFKQYYHFQEPEIVLRGETIEQRHFWCVDCLNAHIPKDNVPCKYCNKNPHYGNLHEERRGDEVKP